MVQSNFVASHTNIVVGLVETIVGLIPAGGGCKEMLARWLDTDEAKNDPHYAPLKVFNIIGYGKTATSPFEAEQLKYIKPQDKKIMNRNSLLEVSKNENPHQFIVDKKIDKEKFPRWKVTFLAMLVDIVTKTGGDVKDCPIVMAASNEYRDDQNSLAQFANEILELDSEGVLKWSGIWETMKKWWQENGKGPKPKTKDLKKFLDRKYGKRKRDTLWHGVRIKDFDNLD
jgi:hypothetical protein